MKVFSNLETSKIFWAIFAKNQSEKLPMYLRCLDEQTYPKNKIILYIRTNDNKDDTKEILENYIRQNGDKFLECIFDDQSVDSNLVYEKNRNWSAKNVRIMAELRQKSLEIFLNTDCDFYFTADTDNFLTPRTLLNLVSAHCPMVAPMLRRPYFEGEPVPLYSNFHSKISYDMFYEKDNYENLILERKIRGLFKVPLIHCTYLIRRDAANFLTYNDDFDDWEYKSLMKSAIQNNVETFIDNRYEYGVIAIDEPLEKIEKSYEAILMRNSLENICFTITHVPDNDPDKSREKILNLNHTLLSKKLEFLPIIGSKLDEPNDLNNNKSLKYEIKPNIQIKNQYVHPKVNLKKNSRHWLIGEIGKLGTFKIALTNFLQTQYNFLLTVADDIWLDDNFTDCLQQFLKDFPENCELLSLYSFENREYNHIEKKFLSNNEFLDGRFSSGVLLWSRVAAIKLLAYFDRFEIDLSLEEILTSQNVLNLKIINPKLQKASIYTKVHFEKSTIYSGNFKKMIVSENGGLVSSLPSSIKEFFSLNSSEIEKILSEFENFKAQNYQDVLALCVSKFKRNGFFVEFGACDGIKLSNTFALEKIYGWSGILAEPVSLWHESLSQNRSSHIFTKAVTDTSGQIFPILVTKSPEVSTLAHHNSDHLAQYRSTNSTIEMVETISINDLLLQGGAPSYIDFMSIDTEGNELEILNALNFDTYTFGFICVEHNNSANKNRIIELIKSKHYVHILSETSLVDAWFINKKYLDF